MHSPFVAGRHDRFWPSGAHGDGGRHGYFFGLRLKRHWGCHGNFGGRAALCSLVVAKNIVGNSSEAPVGGFVHVAFHHGFSHQHGCVLSDFKGT